MATVKGTKKVDKITINTANVIVVTGSKRTKLSIIKSGKNYIYAEAGKDIITVNGGKKNNIYSDAGDDTITVGKKIGTGNVIYGGTGKDSFIIKGGKNNLFTGGAGNDTITVNGGKKNHYYGGAGADTIIINGGSYNVIDGGGYYEKNVKVYGKRNTIIVNGGSNNYISAGDWFSRKELKSSYNEKSKIIINGGSKNASYNEYLGSYQRNYYRPDGGWTGSSGSHSDPICGSKFDDIIIINGGSTNAVDAHDGNDTIVIDGAHDYNVKINKKENRVYLGMIDGAGGNDSITVKTGKNNRICGGMGKDTITVKGGTKNIIYGDYDYCSTGFLGNTYKNTNDTIIISGGQGNKIYGGSGKDNIIVKGGTNNIIDCSYDSVFEDSKWNDSILIEDGSYNTIYGSNGNNVIEIKGGNNNEILALSGDDKITVSGGSGSIDLSYGKNTIIFDWNNSIGKFSVSGEQSDNVLIFNNVDSTAFSFNFSDTSSSATMLISSNNSGGVIEICDWITLQPFHSGIKFKDSMLSYNEINESAGYLE